MCVWGGILKNTQPVPDGTTEFVCHLHMYSINTERKDMAGFQKKSNTQTVKRVKRKRKGSGERNPL